MDQGQIGASASSGHQRPAVTLRRLKVLVTAPTQIGGREMTALTGMGFAHRAVEEGGEAVVVHRHPLTQITAKDITVMKILMKL